ncbi:MAG: CocE/NonD family hydrolase [Gemmatimonadales bacterium]
MASTRKISAVLALLSLALLPAAAAAQSAAGADIRFGVKVPMRDGVRLNATVYSPRGPEEKRPVIMAMTPYIADGYHKFVQPAAQRGYVVAVLDVRGRGSSEGQFDPFRNDAKDGYDAIEWLAAQPWSNGKVGMMGGSYGGFNQWSIAKEFPPHLVTITPTASAYLGVDFPHLGGIWPSYAIQWLTFTTGQTPNANIFGDGGYWRDKFRVRYLEHRPYASLDTLVGNPSAAFQRWITHPDLDDFWLSLAPSPDQLARLSVPILTRTGMYDGDQIGAMEHYRQHMKHGSAAAKANHYLMIGPWDHAGTRTPRREMDGLSFGETAVFDMGSLEADWFDWAMRGGARPAKLPKRVAYYVTGAETWKYADDLDEIGRNPTPYYLTSPGRSATDIFHSGTLATTPADSPGDVWVNDPLDTSRGRLEGEEPNYVDPSEAHALPGGGLIYHSAPFERATEISGFPMLSLWVTMDVLDADFRVSLYEITVAGQSILLDDAQLRARYRESRQRQVLVTPGRPTRLDFDKFRFMSRRIAAGSRLRLLIGSPNTIHLQRNYQSGGDVARETAKDAKVARFELLHDREHRSVLSLPVTPESR